MQEQFSGSWEVWRPNLFLPKAAVHAVAHEPSSIMRDMDCRGALSGPPDASPPCHLLIGDAATRLLVALLLGPDKQLEISSVVRLVGSRLIAGSRAVQIFTVIEAYALTCSVQRGSRTTRYQFYV
jgi:hypothetical protein